MEEGPRLNAETLRQIRALISETAVEADSAGLFRRFYPLAYSFFRHRGFVHQDAEELAQDTVVRAFEKIGTLRQPEVFRAWFLSIGENVYRNELRRRSRQMRAAPEVSLASTREDENRPAVVVSDGDPLPDARFLDQERRDRLRGALAALPPQMRQCFTLRFDRGLKYREIAVVLKISIDTVKAHLFQAKQRLARNLGDEDRGSP